MKTTVEELKTRARMWRQRADQSLYPPFLLLVRGISGVGKTTLVETLFKGVCPLMSTDDYWVHPASGEYQFVRARLAEAHADFRMRVMRHLFQSKLPLVLHNTASRRWECEDLLYVAEQIGYSVEAWNLLPDLSSGQPNLYEIFQKNSHSVPLEKLEEQFQRWESLRPFDEIDVPWHVHRSIGVRP